MTAHVEAIRAMRLPTPNRETDGFGVFREWGILSWHPHLDRTRSYSPVHSGRDYSALPDPVITAPCDCLAYGEMVDGAVGACTMLRPIISGKPSQEMAIYLIHCDPAEDRWTEYSSGDPLTRHAGHGFGAPHLHLEVAVTPDLGRALVAAGILCAECVTWGRWMRKAKVNGFDQYETMEKVKQTYQSWGIRSMADDCIVRAGLPPYKQSQHSKVGVGLTWVVDPAPLMEAA